MTSEEITAKIRVATGQLTSLRASLGSVCRQEAVITKTDLDEMIAKCESEISDLHAEHAKSLEDERAAYFGRP